MISGEAEAVGDDREDGEILLSNCQWESKEVDEVEIFGRYNYPFLVIDGCLEASLSKVWSLNWLYWNIFSSNFVP